MGVIEIRSAATASVSAFRSSSGPGGNRMPTPTELGSEFYREHHQEFSLGARIGARELEARLRALLLRHPESVRVRDPDQAVFLIARGISAIVRRALDERPEKLDEPAFRAELLDLVHCYVAGRPAEAPRERARRST